MGFSMKEGLSKGKEVETPMTLAGAKAVRLERILSDEKRKFYFVAYFISRNPHTTVWVLTESEERAKEYRKQIEKL